jgi:hypothetical protein
MELWAMDVLGPLPMTARGNQYIMVMSDHFTKWVEAVPMLNQRAETVAKAFVNEVVTRHGVPSKLLPDQGRNFEADLMKQVFSLLGVRKLRTSPYHPQTDGKVERMDRTLKGILTAYVNNTITYDWPCLHTVTVCIPRLEFHLSRQFMVAKPLHRWYL